MHGLLEGKGREKRKKESEMNNLKIALLHYSSAPVVGGVEKILHEQCSLCRHPISLLMKHDI